MKNTEDPGAPGPGTILTGNGFIARVNRVAEFIRQWHMKNDATEIIYGVHMDVEAAPIQLTVDDLEAVLNRARPITYPGRAELARALFIADNWRNPDPLVDWERRTAGAEEIYTHVLADAAIAEFKRVNP